MYLNYIAAGNGNKKIAMEDSMEIPWKSENRFTVRPNRPTPKNLPKENETRI